MPLVRRAVWFVLSCSLMLPLSRSPMLFRRVGKSCSTSHTKSAPWWTCRGIRLAASTPTPKARARLLQQGEMHMKAVVFHSVGDIRLVDVPEPEIQAATDAIVRLTTSAICGTDLHFIRGTMPGMKEGT